MLQSADNNCNMNPIITMTYNVSQMAMQQERNKRERFRYRRRTPRLLTVAAQELWDRIELEFGPLDDLTDDEIRHHVAREASISGGPLLVPPVIAARILADLIARCRPNIADADKSTRTKFAEARRLLRKLKDRVRRRRPFRRPRSNWVVRHARIEMVTELKELALRYARQRKLAAKPGTHEHIAFNARQDAAREVAIPHGIAKATLLSWAANPGRYLRRRRPRK
jgi:hypothetical protein